MNSDMTSIPTDYTKNTLQEPSIQSIIDLISSYPIYHTMVYPDIPVMTDIDTTKSLRTIELNYPYDLLCTVISSTHLEALATLEQEELKKNLVKDVFFSPAMKEDVVSTQAGDDCSLVSHGSPYQEYEYSTPLTNDDQLLFFYGHDLIMQSELDGLGTLTTNSHCGCKRRLSQSSVGSPRSSHDRNKADVQNRKKMKLANMKPIYQGLPSLDSHQDYSEEDSQYTDEESQSDIDTITHPLASSSTSTLHSPHKKATPTLYQKLTEKNIDWCRYCGTTEGVNWRPGPWGKRTLCNKHGCDYKGYGFACKLPRLDLTRFSHETIEKRDRPVLQLFCAHCQQQESDNDCLVCCEGCPQAFHQKCYHKSELTDNNIPWFCSSVCKDNLDQNRVVVELPRKRLPLMRTPKHAMIPTI
ncbi:hypothetical protein BDB01DRAFT_834988 [Pilobolus umbonatus]|nr:hypothetical protein BDB01DRAFT_834988 [Pilobolus umbonatus]